ncbi:hypothetical protein KP509_17G019100 [Ceratopteris richardii]|uniref:Uncharacterized protein n=1 Tax=Ceratopteris richardii TaxID=49495 RepID=A0A8T2SU58_CERRI|nr:hypothetical protein KP509_17G019100 [Ceratopteris richardii]
MQSKPGHYPYVLWMQWSLLPCLRGASFQFNSYFDEKKTRTYRNPSVVWEDRISQNGLLQMDTSYIWQFCNSDFHKDYLTPE